MNMNIPSAEAIRASLEALTLRQIDRLAELSGVPRPTLHKIRYGQTPNPGIETVRKFAPHLSAAGQTTTTQEAA